MTTWTIDSGDARQPAAAASTPLPAAARWRIADLGILPLLMSFPLMYYPKVLDGDTQPWVFIGAIIALFTFRTRRFLLRGDIVLVLLALACVVVYAVRTHSDLDLLRDAYTQLEFIALWLVCRREQGEFFPAAVRFTIVVWFLVGVIQYISVAVGHPVEMAGRFVEGRSGVPSLTSEPSTYGSLSMVQMMYLLAEGRSKNKPYLVLAAASVVLSGSLLALILFVFPVMKLKMRARIAVILAIVLLVVADHFFTSAGLTSRISDVGSRDSLLAIFLDPSLNLRLGHIYFTLFQNLKSSLLFSSPVDFMVQYNAFAANSLIFMDTGSNFILTSAGELIYGSGLVGAILILVFIRKAQAQSGSRLKKVEKLAFIAACMLNPIPLSNAFLVIYAQRKS